MNRRTSPPVLLLLALAAFALAAGTSCSRFGPVYPPRPEASQGEPVADPEPARIVAHLTITSAGLLAALEAAVPRAGDGATHLLGADRAYRWERGPLELGFAQGRVTLSTRLQATLNLPIKSVDASLDLHIEAEPIVSSTYAVKLQGLDVNVKSTETSLAVADRVAGLYLLIEVPIGLTLRDFTYDLKPLLAEAHRRIARPIPLPFGAATGCARLRVLEIEAGPTILADGIEKDIALVVAPSVTLPCGDDTADDDALPPMSNVATLVPGPFRVTIPIAARYDELTLAMKGAFTDGKLYFSTEHPGLFLEKPEVYEASGQLVLKLHIRGPVRALGIDADLDGDLFLVGHPAVTDNELVVPDLEPTIETRNLLLSLKALTSADRIRDDARRALRLDLGERLRDVRAKLGADLTFRTDAGCFRGEVDTIEVTGIHPHATYLRVYVSVAAQARITLPCDR